MHPMQHHPQALHHFLRQTIHQDDDGGIIHVFVFMESAGCFMVQARLSLDIFSNLGKRIRKIFLAQS